MISDERLQARLIAWTIATDRRDRAGAPARPAYLAHAKTMNVLCSLKGLRFRADGPMGIT